MSLYGKTPTWRQENFEWDTFGAAKLELVHPWTAQVDVYGEGSAVKLPTMPAFPEVEGFRRGPGRVKRSNDGGVVISVTYEGVILEYAALESTGNEFGVRWSGNTALRVAGIATHPNFAAIAEEFEWDEVKKEFPRTLSGGGQRVPGSLGSYYGYRGLAPGQADERNRMYGVTGYDDEGGVLTRHSMMRTLTVDIWAGANKIAPPPLDLGGFDDGKNWKKGSPTFSPHGDYFRVNIPYLLSGEGGWNPVLY